MKFELRFYFLLMLLIMRLFSWAELVAPECKVLDEFEEVTPAQSVYGKGLLWKVSKAGTTPNYVFGTIHVADESITKIPAKVMAALNNAKTFAMEVIPEASEYVTLASLMYFTDEQKLSDLISKPLFAEVVRLLGAYHLSEEVVTLLKPWAAFLTLSYPPEFGQVLDLQLLALARKNGAEVSGLETLREQVDIFDTMAIDKQLRLLSDTACHYDLVEVDFEIMKSLYVDRDLAGLYAYTQRYSQSDDDLYDELIKKLLIDRNHTMTERMQVMLQAGNAFIAIGAMHLVGEEGVLSLLAKNEYEISLVY
jgi:uncharacterized protein